MALVDLPSGFQASIQYVKITAISELSKTDKARAAKENTGLCFWQRK